MKFLGQRKEQWTNRNSGQTGDSFWIDFHDGEGVRSCKVPETLYRQIERRNLKINQDVEVVGGFIKGQYEGYYYAIVDVVPASMASSSAKAA